jgi:hypothetical protein
MRPRDGQGETCRRRRVPETRLVDSLLLPLFEAEVRNRAGEEGAGLSRLCHLELMCCAASIQAGGFRIIVA